LVRAGAEQTHDAVVRDCRDGATSGETFTSCEAILDRMVKVPITLGARSSVASSAPSVCVERSRFNDSRAKQHCEVDARLGDRSAPSSRPSATLASCCAFERDTSASAPATIARQEQRDAPARRALSRRFCRR